MNQTRHPLDCYVLAVSAGDAENAKMHLLHALHDATLKNSLSMKCGVVQRLGSLLLKQGDELSAKILYVISEAIDPTSLLAKYEHAKFLLNELSDPDAAIKKCDEILHMANESPFMETDDDFGSDHYVEAINHLRLSAIDSMT
jgi:hypothetical protein